jgi:hypothetical protein
VGTLIPATLYATTGLKRDGFTFIIGGLVEHRDIEKSFGEEKI